MRFLNIDGPVIVKDEDFCPHGSVWLEEREGNKVCRVCQYETRQGVRGDGPRLVQGRVRRHGSQLARAWGAGR
jgi:hypothetical protein